jgi:hypothetical protein
MGPVMELREKKTKTLSEKKYEVFPRESILKMEEDKFACAAIRIQII